MSTRPPVRPPAKCGTYTGYQRHNRLGEDACKACKKAVTEYQARKRAADPSINARDKARSRAVWRACKRLAEMHRADYLRLLNEERAKEPALNSGEVA